MTPWGIHIRLRAFQQPHGLLEGGAHGRPGAATSPGATQATVMVHALVRQMYPDLVGKGTMSRAVGFWRALDGEPDDLGAFSLLVGVPRDRRRQVRECPRRSRPSSCPSMS